MITVAQFAMVLVIVFVLIPASIAAVVITERKNNAIRSEGEPPKGASSIRQEIDGPDIEPADDDVDHTAEWDMDDVASDSVVHHVELAKKWAS